jgi:hypothetical protein
MKVRAFGRKEREMISLKIGEILKYLRTGALFEVRKITKDFIILCARNGSAQIMTGKRGFEYIFARVHSIEFPRRDLK